ncbi:MAG TPA: DUF1638 domain-containing protein [Thermoguttaceae bacterium]
MRLKLIACEILYREFCTAIARSPNQIDVEFLPKGLHDMGQAKMFARLKEAIDAVDESQYEAIVLGYALCNNGILGLMAKKIPLVVARAHDCITLFLGSKERYMDYFRKNPGTYFKSSGWIERGEGLAQAGQDSIQRQAGMIQSYEELAAKYGEDNARFLSEHLSNMTPNYSKITYIEMGIEPDDRFEQHARCDAAALGWKYEKIPGDMSLIQDLLDGCWDEDRFLVVPPGCRIAPSYDERIIRLEKVDDS